MIFEYLKKQRDLKQKKKLTQIMIMNLNIPEEQKSLYIQAMDILDDQGIDELYKELIRFVEKFEFKELEDIRKNNFVSIAGLRKKEAREKQKDVNSFSFLINNL